LLKRKEGAFIFYYTVSMKPILDSRWTADQVMKTYPETVSVFLALKLGCVGCALERFCSLDEVAASYKLSTAFLLAQLREAIQV
jgi:hybrid cluster-associated redox disulfide protein